MDLKKIGAFIATCRKRSKLTQFELAERLGVMVHGDGGSGPFLNSRYENAPKN